MVAVPEGGPVRFVDRIARDQARDAVLTAHRSLRDLLAQDRRAATATAGIEPEALAARLRSVAESLTGIASRLEASTGIR